MKRALSLLLCFALCLSLLPASALAADYDDILIIDAEEAEQEDLIRIVEPEAQSGEVRTGTQSHVNPLYRGLVPEELLAAPQAAVAESDAAAEECDGLEELAVAVRAAMIDRETSIPFAVLLDSVDQFDLGLVVDLATAHTGVPDEGDYLRLNYAGMNSSYSYGASGDKTRLSGTLTVRYYTTAEQEAAVTAKVGEVLDSLALDGMSDYDKVCAIYDYITSHVTYDYDNLEDDSYTLKYSAYAALINGTSVCQGYSSLLYRLLLEAGVDCRCITGIGNGGNHAWNIIGLGGLYYNVDVTWDTSWRESGQDYAFFLRCDAGFDDHERGEDYASEEFYNRYPMGDTDYDPAAEALSWPVSGECGDDAAWTLNEDGSLVIEGSGSIYSGGWSQYWEQIKSLTIGEGITAIESWTFANCYKLEEVTIADSVTSIGEEAFSGCRALTHFELPAGVTELGRRPFHYDKGIEAFTVAAGNTAFTAEDGVLFSRDMTTLAAYPLAKEGESYTAPASVTTIAVSAFEGSEKLTAIILPDGLETVEDWAFRDCVMLREAIPPDSLHTLGGGVFLGCTSLQKAAVPEGVTELLWGTFLGCTGLTEISLPSTVTAIAYQNFFSCSALPAVEIPAAVQSIGSMSFGYCESLSQVHFLGSAPAIAEDSFTNVTATAYYPAEDDTWTENVMQNYGGAITWEEEAEAWSLSGACGDELSFTLTEDGKLVIEGSGAMYDYEYNTSPWYPYRAMITSVQLPDGLTKIGTYGLYACYNLTSIEIPESVTDIGGYAFAGCETLESIVLPEGLTVLKEHVFSNCSGLKSLTLPEGLTAIEDYAIYGCKSLTELIIPDGVETIGKMACHGCCELTYLQLPKALKTIGIYAFHFCEKLSSITVPDQVTEIGGHAFSECAALQEVRFQGHVPSMADNSFENTVATAYYYPVPDWTEDVMLDYGGTLTWVCDDWAGEDSTWRLDENGVLTLSGSGETCSYLGLQYQRGFAHFLNEISGAVVEEGITGLGAWTFSEASELKTLSLPSTLEWIGTGAAFRTGLESVTIPENVNTIGTVAFSFCTELKEIRFLGHAPTFNDACFREVTATAYYPADDRTWTADVMQDYEGSITWVEASAWPITGVCGDNATWKLYEDGSLVIEGSGSIHSGNWFQYREQIRSLTVGEGITAIESWTFANCSLQEVTIAKSVTSIGEEAFSYCHALTRFEIPAGVTELGRRAFHYDTGIEAFSVAPGNTAFTAVDGVLFSLDKTVLLAYPLAKEGDSYTVPASVTEIAASAFEGSEKLTAVTLPDGLVTIGDWAFRDCEKLAQAALPGSLRELGGGVFLGCTKLQEATVPEGVTQLLWGTFLGCTGLTEIRLPATVTDIAYQNFMGCSALKSVEIPAAVKTIGSMTFGSCESLTEIRFKGHAPTIGYNCFAEVTATAWYPGGDDSWGPDVMQDYGGAITWKESPKGWTQENGEWVFYNDDGTLRVNAWAKDSKGWCWMDADGHITRNKWIQSGGEWYFLKANGYMAANEWTKDSGGWYYMNAAGKITRNAWTKDSKGWMWMGADGRITKNKWIQSGGEWYFLKADGYMAAKAWARDSGGWYYMGADGKMLKSQWLKDGNYWYYLQANGYMAANTTLTINGKSYSFDASGHWIE